MALFAWLQAGKYRQHGGAKAMQEAGTTVAGMRQTLRMLAQGKAVRVLIAQDADARMQQTVQAAAQSAGVPVEMCESMDALKRKCRIAVPCAAAAEVEA